MKCPVCHSENPDQRKFCRECGSSLLVVCPRCKSENLPSDKFCGACGHELANSAKPLREKLSFDEKLEKIQKYLPRGLAEKVLAQKDKIEGEKRPVTVMFCDVKEFTRFSEKLAPDALNGISAGEYLNKAKAMFEEMDLPWDLEQMEKLTEHAS
jgi:hypothetical protein